MAEAKSPAAKPAAPAGPNRTNAILAWVFAPITSFIFMNDEDEFTRKCAKHSMYFGIADVVAQLIWWVGGSFLAIFLVGMCCWVIGLVWFVFSIYVRVMGAVKANKGELFEVPVISGMVKE